MAVFFYWEAKRAHTFRADRSERYCRRFRYCLPEIVHGYYDGIELVVQIEFYKENDEQVDSLMMDILLMEKPKSKNKILKKLNQSKLLYLRFLSNNRW